MMKENRQKGVCSMAELLYQGHGSFRMTGNNGAVLYLDPFAGSGYEKPADIVLVTHQHGDHNQISKVTRAPGCRIIQNFDALKDGEYRSFSVKGFQIEAVPAYNRNHRREECVGFLVEADGVRCYFAGDTSETAEMAGLRERKIDYAFFPIDGVYNMDAAEASRCAAAVRARHSVPVHTCPGALFSEDAAAEFRAEGKLVLHPGEEVRL